MSNNAHFESDPNLNSSKGCLHFLTRATFQAMFSFFKGGLKAAVAF